MKPGGSFSESHRPGALVTCFTAMIKCLTTQLKERKVYLGSQFEVIVQHCGEQKRHEWQEPEAAQIHHQEAERNACLCITY